jgi:hypothetical protein
MRRALRLTAAVVLLAGALFIALVTVRRWTGSENFDPYWIDYNKPGIDITSEGP